MLTVLKLGGSIITDKDLPETVDSDAIERSVDVIAGALSSEERLVVVHGAGSFGHHYAAKHGVSSSEGTYDASAVTEIHRSMSDLSERIVDALHERGIEALPIRPLSVASRTDGDLQFPSEQIAAMLAGGFVPVTHGDPIIHDSGGVKILSGDEIVVSLASQLNADRVGLCSTVPGVFDEDGDIIETIDNYDEVAGALGESEATDVTGGMAGKVRQLLELDVPASVFDLDQLETFLADGTAGTVVRGSE
jgi:isopentenyl phosphate kinase